MISGVRYRAAGITGTLLITALAVTIANHPVVQTTVLGSIPVLSRLPETVLWGSGFANALLTTMAIVGASLVPLYKPRPRRILDTILQVQKQILLAGFALAAIGYFDYTYRLPRSTLIVTVAVLLVYLPGWFVSIRRRPSNEPKRAVIIGDDPEQIEDILTTIDFPVLGYVSPPSPYDQQPIPSANLAMADGSGAIADPLDEIVCLGGLSRLDDIIVEYDVDTAILAFSRPDRVGFFSVLDACYEHGVAAKAHREHVDSILTDSDQTTDIVDIDLEPWDWQDYVFKRIFDAAFAATGLLLSAPLMVVFAVAIKLDSPGPVFYKQERTAEFGDTFSVYKFRSMLPESEAAEPGEDENRVTRVGRFLRQTHLDELPQLWAILLGQMSVVGPRAAWTDEERLLEREAKTWRKRWFVKPGLTGLAQINNVKSTEPERKLRYDIEYIRQQSFWYDVMIVIRQVWMVLEDMYAVLAADRRS
ncbi:sugar transferase [Halobacteriaceae archaeon GCM10025711]